MKSFQPINAHHALEGKWAGLVLQECVLPWEVPLVSWTHPKGATKPPSFLAQAIVPGMLFAPPFWMHPELSPEQVKGDLVRGDVVEWRGRVRTGKLPTLTIEGLVSSTGEVWRWSSPFTVEAGEVLAIVGAWH